MALSEQDKQEIRMLVRTELQNVLTHEFAEWWAEAILAGQLQDPTTDTIVRLTEFTASLNQAQALIAQDLEYKVREVDQVLQQLSQQVDSLELETALRNRLSK